MYNTFVYAYILLMFFLIGVRDRIDPWIKKLQCNGDIEKQWYYKRRFIDRLRNSKIAEETDKANEQHYEVPTDFYITVRLWF